MSNLKVYAKTIEDEALEQINTLLSQDTRMRRLQPCGANCMW